MRSANFLSKSLKDIRETSKDSPRYSENDRCAFWNRSNILFLAQVLLKVLYDRIVRVPVKVIGDFCLYTFSAHKASSSLESMVICVVYEELESRGHVL